jgi:hypothetical protein
MAERTTVSGNLSVHDCKERVALEFLDRISAIEKPGPDLRSGVDLIKNREYYLALMYQCIEVANGAAP